MNTLVIEMQIGDLCQRVDSALKPSDLNLSDADFCERLVVPALHVLRNSFGILNPPEPQIAKLLSKWSNLTVQGRDKSRAYVVGGFADGLTRKMSLGELIHLFV
jgi:hypothetical protein